MQSSCYKFSSQTLNWYAAKSACEALGSSLVVINSQAEQQAFDAKVIQASWLGLYRNPKDKSRWLWVDGSSLTYTSWYSGEPNNSGGSEDCAEMFSTSLGWKWNDAPCTTSYRYICETNGRSDNKTYRATRVASWNLNFNRHVTFPLSPYI